MCFGNCKMASYIVACLKYEDLCRVVIANCSCKSWIIKIIYTVFHPVYNLEGQGFPSTIANVSENYDFKMS